jgi:hypothetical protein
MIDQSPSDGTGQPVTGQGFNAETFDRQVGNDSGVLGRKR